MIDSAKIPAAWLPATAARVSVCIPTYRRPDRLRDLLDDLAKQSRLPDQVVVVDNDSAGSARAVVDHWCSQGAPFPIEYAVQPEPSIAITRNRTVELARGEWLAFVDDDERAPADWLRRLLYAAEIYHADCVLAPVEPQVPATAPRWIRMGRFYDFPHQPDGAVVPLNRMRFGNLIMRAQILCSITGPFDPTLGLMAGEDVDMLVRLARAGARIVWYNDAPVYEPIEQRRLSLKWLILRSISGGQGFARYTIRGGFRPINSLQGSIFFLRAFAQMMAALGLMAVSVPFGKHRAIAWLLKASANFGKLSVLWGWRYRAYARPP